MVLVTADQIDTAAIRAAYPDGYFANRGDLLALCDALDETRSERDGAVLCGTELIEQCRIWRDRAEAAEARITAALALKDALEEIVFCDLYLDRVGRELVEKFWPMMEAALTGDQK